MTDLDRTQELLERCTALENEKRMWKARAKAAHDILTMLMMELPIMNRIMGLGVTEDEIRDVTGDAWDLHMRVDQLERDVWTGAARMVRDFIKAVDANPGLRMGLVGLAPQEILEEWIPKFRSLFDECSHCMGTGCVVCQPHLDVVTP